MPEMFTTATWVAKPGETEAFVDAWQEFADWAAGMEGAGTLRLSQDLGATGRFVSFGRWSSIEAAHRWKANPEFPARMAAVQRHVAQFAPAELEVVREVGSPEG